MTNCAHGLTSDGRQDITRATGLIRRYLAARNGTPIDQDMARILARFCGMTSRQADLIWNQLSQDPVPGTSSAACGHLALMSDRFLRAAPRPLPEIRWPSV